MLLALSHTFLSRRLHSLCSSVLLTSTSKGLAKSYKEIFFTGSAFAVRQSPPLPRWTSRYGCLAISLLAATDWDKKKKKRKRPNSIYEESKELDIMASCKNTSSCCSNATTLRLVEVQCSAIEIPLDIKASS